MKPRVLKSVDDAGREPRLRMYELRDNIMKHHRFWRCFLWAGVLGMGVLSSCNRPPSEDQALREAQEAAARQAAASNAVSPGASLVLKSPAFAANGALPPRFTCDGDGVSPPLMWSGVPKSSVTLALLCQDPDAPGGVWTHWVLWNLPAPATRLLENIGNKAKLGSGAEQGSNSWKKIGYGGACPPSGTHRYVFTLYALDASLKLPASANATELQAAMKGHILVQSSLTGTYSKS